LILYNTVRTDTVLTSFTFFNVKTGEYVPIEEGQSGLENNHLGEFVSDNGQITIKLEKFNSINEPYISIPEFVVKGAVK